jgi:hypothetical protein
MPRLTRSISGDRAAHAVLVSSSACHLLILVLIVVLGCNLSFILFYYHVSCVVYL